MHASHETKNINLSNLMEALNMNISYGTILFDDSTKKLEEQKSKVGPIVTV